MKQRVLIVAIFLFQFIYLSQSHNDIIVYKRYHRRHPIKVKQNKQSQFKYVEEIKEVFKTNHRPPLFGSSDAAIEQFLKCDFRCKKKNHIKSKIQRKQQNAMNILNITTTITVRPTIKLNNIVPTNIASTINPPSTTTKVMYYYNKTAIIPTFSPKQIETTSNQFKQYLNQTQISANTNDHINFTRNSWTIPEISVIRYNKSMMLPTKKPSYFMTLTTEFNWNWLKPNNTISTTKRPIIIPITSPKPISIETTTNNSNDDWLRAWFNINSAATTELSTAKFLSTRKTEILSKIPFLTTTIMPSITAPSSSSSSTQPSTNNNNNNNFGPIESDNNNNNDKIEEDEDDVYDGDDDEDDEPLDDDDVPIEETIDDSDDYEDDYEETSQMTEV